MPPTVYFPNGGHCGYAAAAQIKRSQKEFRVVGMVHSDEISYYETLQYYEPIIDRFIGVSYAIAGKLKQVLPPGREQDVICLPYGVPIPGPVKRAVAPYIRLLYAGRLAEPQKRVSRLAELANTLTEMGVPYEFHLAGDGPERKSLEKSMGAKATFHGSLDTASVQALMNQCDVIVQLSDFEGTSLTMLEGMASGMVPVMSAVTGIDAVIEHGMNGFLHPIGDISMAATHIAALHGDPALQERAGHAARQKVSEHFSIKANAAQIASLCHDLMEQPSSYRVMSRPAFPLTKESRIFWEKAKGKIQSTLGNFKERFSSSAAV
jgi:glycosyltransferase involved in cell wall biosynthesis